MYLASLDGYHIAGLPKADCEKIGNSYGNSCGNGWEREPPSLLCKIFEILSVNWLYLVHLERIKLKFNTLIMHTFDFSLLNVFFCQ